MSYKKLEKKKGFTLAETLITLAIVGVVASITIPGLVRDVQDKQYKAKFKKKYSEFAQVTRMLVADAGGDLTGYFDGPGADDEVEFYNKYAQYMSFLKYCPVGQDAGKCWHTTESKYLNGTPITSGTSTGRAILKDGSLISFGVYGYGSAQCNGVQPKGDTCAYVSIDVNGFKGPNTWGRDIFGFYVAKTITHPYGVKGDSYYYSCNSDPATGHAGHACAAWVLRNKDY